MSHKKIFSIFATLLLCNTANATAVFDNGISVLNINMLTHNLMSYAHYGENMSQDFKTRNVYGTMTRFDEYGDDGSTLKIPPKNSTKNDSLFADVWLDMMHINTKGHYNHTDTSKRNRLYMATVGGDTQKINTEYGDVNFGVFVGSVFGDTESIDALGNSVGVFAHFENQDFDAAFLLNNGSINNNSYVGNFSNAWFNIAMDASHKFRIDKTMYFQPQIYFGYNWISSDNLYINGDTVSTKNFNLFNIAPGARVVKNIIDNWYGALSVKYMATFGDKKDIYINGARAAKIAIDNYTEIGMNIEYDYEQFVFGAGASKQIGGYDGWAGNINVKYLF